VATALGVLVGGGPLVQRNVSRDGDSLRRFCLVTRQLHKASRSRESQASRHVAQ
jgi:hypothetical protein